MIDYRKLFWYVAAATAFGTFVGFMFYLGLIGLILNK